MSKIGIVGGTFNPIHSGHLAIGQIAYENLGLDKVIFVPSFLPPHKTGRNVIDAKDRFKMVNLAIKDFKYFESSDCEIKRKGKSYSIDTVVYFEKILKVKEPVKYFFIIGEDCLEHLHQWKDIDILLKKVNFVAITRPGYQKDKTKIKVHFIEMPGLDIASTYIRRRVLAGKCIKHLVPEKVAKYIEMRKLYK